MLPELEKLRDGEVRRVAAHVGLDPMHWRTLAERATVVHDADNKPIVRVEHEGKYLPLADYVGLLRNDPAWSGRFGFKVSGAAAESDPAQQQLRRRMETASPSQRLRLTRIARAQGGGGTGAPSLPPVEPAAAEIKDPRARLRHLRSSADALKAKHGVE